MQTPEFRQLLKRAKSAWRVMRRRCLEPGFRDFKRYGAMGITICPQWRVSFDQFLKDMGLPPSQEHWLGRLDVTGHYTPDNCHWTLQAPQKGRRAYCRMVTVAGVTMTAAQAGRLPGQPQRNSVLRRWEAGFSLTHPKLAKIYRRSMWLQYQGEILPLPVWARRIGLSNSVLWFRIKRGWPIEKAMTPTKFRNHPPKKSEGENRDSN